MLARSAVHEQQIKCWGVRAAPSTDLLQSEGGAGSGLHVVVHLNFVVHSHRCQRSLPRRVEAVEGQDTAE